MSAYTVFEKETGQITMSQMVFDDPDGRYGRVLSEREMNFIGHDTPGHAQLDRHFVWQGELSERPYMFCKIDRKEIGIGEGDGARISNIPNGAHLRILAGGIEFFSEVIAGPKVDLSAPVPGIYTVVIHKWPYRDFTAQVVAR